MVKIFGTISTIVAILLTIPCFFILLTWNALPGEFLYPLKRGFEEIPRLIFQYNPQASANYEVQITSRRFTEASKLIDEQNTLGLAELNSSIVEAKNKAIASNSTQAKKELQNNLADYKQKLDEKKHLLTSQDSNSVSVSNTKAGSEKVIVQITETEQIIEEVIGQIDKNQTTPKTLTPTGSIPDLTPSGFVPSGTGKSVKRTIIRTTTKTTINPDGTTTVEISTSSSVLDN